MRHYRRQKWRQPNIWHNFQLMASFQFFFQGVYRNTNESQFRCFCVRLKKVYDFYYANAIKKCELIKSLEHALNYPINAFNHNSCWPSFLCVLYSYIRFWLRFLRLNIVCNCSCVLLKVRISQFKTVALEKDASIEPLTFYDF